MHSPVRMAPSWAAPEDFVIRGLDGADLKHRQKQPDAGDVDGEARELIAGPRAKWAGPARAAQGANQASALAALNQDQQNHEQADEKKKQVRRTGKPGPHYVNFSGIGSREPSERYYTRQGDMVTR